MNVNYPNKYAWSPRYLAGLGSVAMFALLIFNRSEYKIRFLEWGLGAAVLLLTTLFFILRGKIVKKELAFLLAPLLWMGYAFLGTLFAFDVQHHLFSLFQAASLSLIASFTIVSVFTREKLAPKVLLVTATFWTLINIIFFIAWLLGRYTYEGGDFTGIFANRNVYAIQTVIISSLVFSLTKKTFYVWLIIALSFIMVVASLSIKGVIAFLFILFFPCFYKANFRKKIIIVLGGLIIFAAAVMILPDLERRLVRFSMAFTNRDQLRMSESAFMRPWLIAEGSRLSLQNPVFGVGVDNSKFFLISPVKDKGTYSHNNYIEMLLNAGIIGIFLHYFPLIYVYLKIRRTHKFHITVKMYILLYAFLGLVLVEYNIFSTILLYSLPVFLYLYFEDAKEYAPNTLHCQHS